MINVDKGQKEDNVVLTEIFMTPPIYHLPRASETWTLSISYHVCCSGFVLGIL